MKLGVSFNRVERATYIFNAYDCVMELRQIQARSTIDETVPGVTVCFLP